MIRNRCTQLGVPDERGKTPLDDIVDVGEQTSIAKLRVKRAEDYRSYYVNNVQVMYTHYDLRLAFGEIAPDENGCRRIR